MIELHINKRYLITGGAGFLGSALIERLNCMGFKNLIVVTRNEGQLINLKNKYPNIQIVTGDIADSFICDKVCDVDGIFHLAAFKFVDLAEENVRTCINSNVIGTMNILEATRKYCSDFVLGISTDKAAQVKGIYGATKLLVEGLFREYEKINPETEYRTVRYGNVLGSTGSFITKWQSLMEQGKEVIITDPKATRFFWTVDEAINLVFDCLNNATDSKPFIPKKMKSIDMGTALKFCQEAFGNCPVKEIGLREGENLHETLDGITYSNEVEQYSKEEFANKFLK